MSSWLKLGGAGLEAKGVLEEGKAAYDAGQYNAATSRTQGVVEENRRRTVGKKEISKTRTGVAKSGITFEGTPLNVLVESAANVEIDALNARWSGEQRAKAEEYKGYSAYKASQLKATAILVKGTADFLESGEKAAAKAGG
jgi:hypothetical protein